MSGAASSWTVIPEFSSAVPGRLTATLNIAWPAGGTLYILWADDNGAASDSACQIDNFSAVAIQNQVPVAITNSPQSQTVAELAPATFTVGASGYLPPTLQWYSNNVAIPNATNATYSIASAPASYNGLAFKVIAQNVASNITYFATSSVATLTVTADTVAPALVNASAVGSLQVLVNFSERITAATATNLANYALTNINGVVSITNATLGVAQTNVLLDITPAFTGGISNILTVNGLRDISAAANLIATNSQAGFFVAATNVPAIVSVTNVGNTGVQVVYSIAVDAASATNIAYYSLTKVILLHSHAD